jgi:hypothetical protein
LQACIASEKELNRLLDVSRTPLQQDVFYYNCIIGLALAGVGSALMAYGIYSKNAISSTIGATLVAGGLTGLYNNGLFSIREGSKIPHPRVSELVATELAMQ